MQTVNEKECAVSLTDHNTAITENALHQLRNPFQKKDDLQPEFMFAEDASKYLNTTTRKIALYRKHGLLKWAKFGKSYVYKKTWLDDFAEDWSGYDLSNENAILLAINSKKWRSDHDY